MFSSALTLSALQREAQKKLRSVSSSPVLDTELLLSAALKKSREWLWLNPDFQPGSKEKKTINNLLKRRLRHEPMAYILGKKEFFSLTFLTNTGVLIPRPETELLVEKILERIAQTNVQDKTLVLDIGTGSGCILTALAKNLPARKNLTLIGTDVSKKALDIAQKNLKKHKLVSKTSLVKSSLTAFLQRSSWPKKLAQTKHLFIAANLPYVSLESYQKNKINLKWEPRLALTAPQKGLKIIQKLILELSSLKKQYPALQIVAILEHDPAQKKILEQFIQTQTPAFKFSAQKDLSNRFRFSVLKSPK